MSTMQETRYQARMREIDQRRADHAEAVKRSKGRVTKVKMHTALAGKPSCPEGGVVTLPEFEAKAMVDSGYAEEVTE